MTELTTTFKEVKKFKLINIRGLVRDLALDVLSIKIKIQNAKAIFEKPRIQFLYIHHVFDDEINIFDKLQNYFRYIIRLLATQMQYIKFPQEI